MLFALYQISYIHDLTILPVMYPLSMLIAFYPFNFTLEFTTLKVLQVPAMPSVFNKITGTLELTILIVLQPLAMLVAVYKIKFSLELTTLVVLQRLAVQLAVLIITGILDLTIFIVMQLLELFAIFVVTLLNRLILVIVVITSGADFDISLNPLYIIEKASIWLQHSAHVGFVVLKSAFIEISAL